jgi:hypothetical protein
MIHKDYVYNGFRMILNLLTYRRAVQNMLKRFIIYSVISKMVKSSGKRPTSSNSSSSTYSSITSTQPSTQTTNPTASSTPSALVQSAVEQHFQQLENRLDVSSTRMDNIENLCLQLKSNTDVITQQLNKLATNLSVNYSSTSPCCSPAAKTICLSGGL